MRRFTAWLVVLLTLCTLASRADAQVTTSGVTGTVKDGQGAVIPGATVSAVHQPSGSTYEAVTQADGRFLMQGMRPGGPYTVTASLTGFRSVAQNNLQLNLGVTQDLSFTLELANITETITVVGATSPIFSSNRTGAATSVSRDDLASLPTVSGRINDITRLAPQAGSGGTFAGQDNRMNNITVDGSYFNNSFGLGGQPGDRTGVAPISLEAVEQVQVNVAPYDVRQGNFIGAGVNMVTRSGTNKLVASVYSRYRNQSYVGTEAAGLPYNPGTFTTKTIGVTAGGPIVANRLFAFGSFEKQEEVKPLSSFTSRADASVAAVGNTTRVLTSDMDTLAAFLKSKYNYDPGVSTPVDKLTPGKPFSIKFDYNLSKGNKVNFRYSRLDSSTDVLLSGSTSAGRGRSTNTNNWLGFSGSNYQILENIRSGIAEWSSVLGSSMSNSLTIGYTTNNESRNTVPQFPFVDILDGTGGTSAYTSFGPDPFTRNNELYYHTFQAQDTFTKFMNRHTLTFGVSLEKYHSDNVFYQLANGVYTYNSLADFYTAANGGTVTLNRYQLAYVNVPGLDKPLQQLDPWYTGGYAQDQYKLDNLTITAGVRVDMASFKQTGFDNPNADKLTFLQEDGSPIQYNTGKLPDSKPLWSPRIGLNWDVFSDQSTQLRGGTGVFTGKPAYVWISNQIGNTGLLLGRIDVSGETTRAFSPNPDAYRPVGTGAPATSYELNMTDPNFKFPQTWRTNLAVDQKLPWGVIGTAEYIYNRDLNGIYYINANLPLAQSTFTGIDARPRWVGTSCTTPAAGGCITRINNDPGNVVTANYVIKNQNVGRSWSAAGTLSKQMSNGLSLKGAYSYGLSRNTVDAGSTASGTWTTIAQVNGANNPGLSYSSNAPGHRAFVNASYTRQYFSLGSTTISAFWEARTNQNNFSSNVSYVYGGDMNQDGTSNNDLIYIPRNASEMFFTAIPATSTTRAFSVDEQVAAFEAYISQDPYLSKHRGEYAQRNGLFNPLVKRMDVSVIQDVFHNVGRSRHSGQVRLDITNFGNLMNSKWGVGQRTVVTPATSNLVPILNTPVYDAATNKVTYRMAVVNNALPTTTWQTTTFSSDVYTLMLSFRYSFN